MQLSPALEPLVYTDPQGLLSKTAHLEKAKIQAPPEFSVNVSRVSTVALELNRRRSSAAPGFTPSARGSEPPVHSSDEAVLDETPQMKRTLKVAPTEPRTADRRRSSAAPGITAPPPKTIGEGIEVGAQSKSPTKKPKQGANYPTELQYPPAPAYPLRKTPLWTKPDARTPSPKVTTESPPKKGGWLNFGAKPEEELPELEESKVRQSSQPALDPSEVQPFRSAAPGSPEAPGGTQKRQNSYPSQTRQATYRQDSSAPPVRRADTRPRQISVYVNKGDYYPVSSILLDRIDDDSQFQPSPSRRNSYSIPQSASIPENSSQDEACAQYSRRVLSGPSRRQSQSQGALYTQKDAAVSSRAPTFQIKLETEDETSRASQELREEGFQEPVRRDFPKKKARQTKESQTNRRAGFRNCLVLKCQGDKNKSKSKSKSQSKSQQHEPTNKVVLGSRLKWFREKNLRLPMPKFQKMKTSPPAAASIAQAGPSTMTMPGLTARSTSRAQRPSQDHTPEMKVTEDYQAQTQKKRKSHERRPVVQPQDERLIPQQPSSLHEKTQQPPHEGHRRRSRGRTRDGSRQQSEKTEQRQSSQKYQRSPEHRRDRRRSPQYLDKQVSGEGLPLLEGVQQFPRSFARHSSQINKGRQLKINPAARVQRCDLAYRGTTRSAVIYCN
ncbi:hypothetical protein J4E91_000629 [Alternaria rosae]|nr:hypothetical protein J4E91_000629 [Alternaria rosae]